MSSAELLEQAITLSRVGWRTFPIVRYLNDKGDWIKKPAIKGYHGADPFSEQELRRLPWRKATHIGVTFGPHHLLLDVDVKKGARGDRHLVELERRHGPLPPTAQQWTPSGGRHLLYRSHARLGPGVPSRPRLPDGRPAHIDLVRYRLMYAVVYEWQFLWNPPTMLPYLPDAWRPILEAHRQVIPRSWGPSVPSRPVVHIEDRVNHRDREVRDLVEALRAAE